MNKHVFLDHVIEKKTDVIPVPPPPPSNDKYGGRETVG